MKILHTADLHIGSPLTAYLSKERVRERKAELVDTFRRLAEEAVFLGAEAVIIAGDMFDSESVPRGTIKKIISIIEGARGVDFLYLSGNHEKNALVDSGVALPESLRIFGKEWSHIDYGFLRITGRSEITENMFDTLSLSRDMKNIVVLHGALGEGRTGDEVIGIRDAEDRGIDYLALGHYHSYSERRIDDRGVAVYSGTPEGRGFDEAGKKGFVLIDTDGRRLSHSFYPFAKREIHIAEVDLTGTASHRDIEERIQAKISGIPERDIVRVELVGERAAEVFADSRAIFSRWQDCFYHFELKDSSRALIDPESYRYNKSLKGEFIRLVMEREDISDSDKELIIRAGIYALMGEEIDI